ncbi:unnamed protein product [Linum tenue]|uniref:Uncharacterized protein n=1 Tax=Linum tenue TaxID=586396 RepID=A0AAV0PRT4_9ROSI|nr:unnamed protein product [Linum tenue]
MSLSFSRGQALDPYMIWDDLASLQSFGVIFAS